MTDLEDTIKKTLIEDPLWTKEAVADYYQMLLDLMMEDYDTVAKRIPRWIPVSVRLPERPEGYQHSELRRSYFLVSLASGCVESLGFDFDEERWHPTGSPVVA